MNPAVRRALLVAALAAVALPSVAAAGDFRLLRLDGFNVKWGEALLGHGAVVSYGFATAAETLPGATNCRSMAP